MTENGTAPAPPDEDRTPTQSDEAPIKPAEEWVMPQPVFRRSDGFTPRPVVGNEDPTITPDSITTMEIDTADQSENSAAAVAGAPLIAEQPDIIADGAEPADAIATPSAPKKGGFLRLLLMILGIAIIAVAIGAVITGVVLWYFFQVSESQNLN